MSYNWAWNSDCAGKIRRYEKHIIEPYSKLSYLCENGNMSYGYLRELDVWISKNYTRSSHFSLWQKPYSSQRTMETPSRTHQCDRPSKLIHSLDLSVFENRVELPQAVPHQRAKCHLYREGNEVFEPLSLWFPVSIPKHWNWLIFEVFHTRATHDEGDGRIMSPVIASSRRSKISNSISGARKTNIPCKFKKHIPLILLFNFMAASILQEIRRDEPRLSRKWLPDVCKSLRSVVCASATVKKFSRPIRKPSFSSYVTAQISF